ncbi:MAG: nuclear transport factor 2 family protein [Thermomicrobiales bacterium]
MNSIERFVHEWIETWNANDLERLLAHYTDDAVFESPRAQMLTGSARVEGKEALRAYWGASIARSTSRHFVLDRHLWDVDRNELLILYTNQVDGSSTRACEVFHFNGDGLVDRAEALYGATRSEP